MWLSQLLNSRIQAAPLRQILPMVRCLVDAIVQPPVLHEVTSCSSTLLPDLGRVKRLQSAMFWNQSKVQKQPHMLQSCKVAAYEKERLCLCGFCGGGRAHGASGGTRSVASKRCPRTCQQPSFRNSPEGTISRMLHTTRWYPIRLVECGHSLPVLAWHPHFQLVFLGLLRPWVSSAQYFLRNYQSGFLKGNALPGDVCVASLAGPAHNAYRVA